MKKSILNGLLSLFLSVLIMPHANAKAVCGNGKVEESEACDDGNTNNFDGCKYNCSLPICGDSIKSYTEQCDNGSNNSDIAANACRTNCRSAHCGDGVTDRGEQCDAGSRADLPNVCRSDCKLPRCGDGVVDNAPPFNEQCDDGNPNNDDGCNTACQKCEMLDQTGNLSIAVDTEVCSKAFQLDDDGDYGAITIKRNGVTLDCNGAELNGAGRGYGIYIYRARNVTIKNCKVRAYEVGIRLEDGANATLSNNQVCGNSRSDIELVDTPVGLGRKNACMNSGGWNDQGRAGCSQQMAACNFDSRSLSRTKQPPPTPAQQETDKPMGETKDDVPAFLRRLLIKP